MFYTFEAENNKRYKVKIEINTREHFSALGFTNKLLSYQNDWHSAECFVTTYELEELVATKLRALYQRKKGRDFFDIGLCLELFKLNTDLIVGCFNKYLSFTNSVISRANLEENIFDKLTDQSFLFDIAMLLPKKIDISQKIGLYKDLLYKKIIKKVRGRPWKGDFTRCLNSGAQSKY